MAYDPRLREIAFGEREGMTFEESMARFPDQMRRLLRSEEVRFPGGETYPETAERFAAALPDLTAAMGADDTVVVASHGGAMRAGTCRFLGFPPASWDPSAGSPTATGRCCSRAGTAGGSTSGTPARCPSR